MPYTIEEHKHRLAAWAAATAASTSPKRRFKVSQGVLILEACGFNAAFDNPNKLPTPSDIDNAHRKWRIAVISAAETQRLNFTHGVAAKLLNCYLKIRFVCGGHHDHRRVKRLHPPIDRLLLTELAGKNFGNKAKDWRKFRNAGWSNFDSGEYEGVIALIRDTLASHEPLWKIEEHWRGHQ